MKLLLNLLRGRFFAMKIYNQGRKLGEADEYWRIPVHHKHGTEFLLFTDHELEKGRERAKKNLEDL